MSDTLRPKDFGLPDVPPTKTSKKLCRACADSFQTFRWSDLVCPDCDIERMARIEAGLKAVADAMDRRTGC